MSKQHPSIALVDCNNFFVSCERAFQPWLEGKPVVVLSSNDGCVISRSDEAKRLGIEMAAPYFKMRPLVRAHDIEVRSANFTLYGDMSRRVMETLETVSPEVEVYSVDECFVGLAGEADVSAAGKAMRQKVLQWTGLPVSVGIGPTKTLAKLANYLAKRSPLFRVQGVCDLSDAAVRARLLPLVPVGEVWGIGRRLTEKLKYHGIHTAADLRDMNLARARGLLNVIGVRTVEELRGTPCLSLELMPAPQKGMAVTRSFGQVITEKNQMKTALAGFAEQAGEKLRRQGLIAGQLQVFLRTGRSKKSGRYLTAPYFTLPVATDCTIDLLRAVNTAVDKLWQPGIEISKAGIMLGALLPACDRPADLFVSPSPARGRLMQAVDAVNRRLGKKSIGFAAAGAPRAHPAFAPLQSLRSPGFTTDFQGLPRVFS